MDVARALVNVVTLALASAIVIAAARGSTTVDFAVYYAGGRAAATTSYVDEQAVGAILRDEGLPRSVLAPVPYGSPALIATVFRPLAALDARRALAVYYAACLLLLSYTAWRLSPRWTGPMLLGLVLSGPFFHALTLGNWSVVTGCLTLLAYLDVRGRCVTRASAWLSLATLWKLFPIVLFVPFAVKRMRRPLIVASCVGAAGVVLSIVVLRPQEFAEAVRFGLTVMRPTNTTALNLSIPGLVYRVTEDGRLAGALAIALPMLVALAVWCWRAKPLHDLLAVATVAMLLTNGLTWPHYAVSLFVFLPWLGDQPLPSWAKRAGMWLFAVVMFPWFVLMAGEAFAASAYARFPHLPGAVLMLAFMVAVMQRNAARGAEPTGAAVR